uniref:Uncharacterized protein n=1 Tax=Strigamia maritima TaxID=126957 RepID=T1IYR0_STRMM
MVFALTTTNGSKDRIIPGSDLAATSGIRGVGEAKGHKDQTVGFEQTNIYLAPKLVESKQIKHYRNMFTLLYIQLAEHRVNTLACLSYLLFEVKIMNGQSKIRIYYIVRPNKKRVIRMRPKYRFGLRKMKKPLNVGFHTFRLFLLLLSVGVCVWQVSVCLDRFLQEPISTIVLMQNDFHNYTFPTMVACPNQFIKINLPYKMVFSNISRLDYKLWKENDVKDAFIGTRVKLKCQLKGENLQQSGHCQEAINDCKEISEFGTPIDTVQGHCSKFINSNVYRFTGTDYGQTWLLFPRMQKNSSGQISLSPRIVYKYNLQHEKLTLLPVNFIIFTVTENLNAYRNPCWPEDDVINCMNSCMDNLLLQTNITCTMPFHINDEQTIPICPTIREMFNFLDNHLNKAYLKRDTCKCRRPCKSAIYSTVIKSLTDSKNKEKYAMVMIGIPKITVVEYFSFPFSSLAAEILSNVGFFLGISMISILDFTLQMSKVLPSTMQKIKRSVSAVARG